MSGTNPGDVDELTLEGIKQFSVDVEKEEWKFDTLCDLYDTLTTTQTVIFCNTRQKVSCSRSLKISGLRTPTNLVPPSASPVFGDHEHSVTLDMLILCIILASDISESLRFANPRNRTTDSRFCVGRLVGGTNARRGLDRIPNAR